MDTLKTAKTAKNWRVIFKLSLNWGTHIRLSDMGMRDGVPLRTIYISFSLKRKCRFRTSMSCIFLLVSSVRSSYSHPDLLVIQNHPLFLITPVLDTRLSLSETIELYQKQSLDSSAGYMYTLWVQQDITAI